MNSKEKQCFDSVHNLIKRDVRACDIQDYLFETAVLTLDELDSLDVEKNPKRQTEMLLQWLQERPAAFGHFRESLRARYPYIVQEMDDVQATSLDTVSTLQHHQQTEMTKNYEIVGDGNFFIADSEKTRVHMKHRDVPRPGPS